MISSDQELGNYPITNKHKKKWYKTLQNTMGYGEIVRNDYSTRRDWAIWTYTTASCFTKGSAFRTGPRLGNVHRGCFWPANQRQWKVCCETVRLVKTLGKIMKKQSIVGYSIRWSTNAGFRYNDFGKSRSHSTIFLQGSIWKRPKHPVVTALKGAMISFAAFQL